MWRCGVRHAKVGAGEAANWLMGTLIEKIGLNYSAAGIVLCAQSSRGYGDANVLTVAHAVPATNLPLNHSLQGNRIKLSQV